MKICVVLDILVLSVKHAIIKKTTEEMYTVNVVIVVKQIGHGHR